MTTETYENPYPGLRPFEAEESHLFFGREGLSEELLRRLCRNHFIAVVGTSGSGKSSLVRAGLLPLLYGGFMPDAGANWRVAVIKPGKNPIRNLAAALAHPADYETKALSYSTEFETMRNFGGGELSEDEKLKIAVTETVLRRSAVGLLQYAAGNELAPGENLLVVVDQFEEIFRFKEKSNQTAADQSESAVKKPEDEAAAFVKLLIEAAGNKASRVYVAITMRSDFLGDCAQFRDLPETINDGQYLIPRLTREQLRNSIEAPAKVFGAQVTPALVTRLLNDIGEDQDQLPVLQHALMRTWRIWTDEKKPDAPLDVSHYEATGGMAEALSRHANRAYGQLSEERQTMAEKLFKCLTVIDNENREVRRATELGKLCAIVTGKNDFSPADLGEVIYVINAFRRPGRTFLMPPPDVPLDANSLVDISHESLIRKWDRLRDWVAAEAKHAHRYRRLAEDAFAESSFWDDPELREALDWYDEFKPNETWARLYYDFWAQRELADFPATMKFLNDSKQNRDDELAEKQRSREALEKYARTLRYAVIGLLILLLATTGLTIYAFRQQQLANTLLGENREYTEKVNQSAVEIAKNARELEGMYEDLVIEKENAETARNKLQATTDDLESKTQQLEKNEQNLQVAFTRQKEATQKAEQNEREKQAAYEKQKQLTAAATEAGKIAEEARAQAVALYEAEEKANAREKLNRRGLTSLEKNLFRIARADFTELFKGYRDDPKLTETEKQDGMWWALHNLGTVNWKLRNFDEAASRYREALEILREPAEETSSRILQPSGFAQSPQPVFYQWTNNEIDQSKIATLQRLAQLYRERARSSSENAETIRLNTLAMSRYRRLLNLLRIDAAVIEDARYKAEIEIEFADTQFDLNDNSEARKYYERALARLKRHAERNLPLIITAQNKLSKVALRQKDFGEAEERIKTVLEIRQKELGFSPYHPDLAESYNDLADIYYSQDESDEEKQKQSQIENQPQEKKQDENQNQPQAQVTATPKPAPKSENQTKANNYLSLARLIKRWNEVTKTKTKPFYEYYTLASAYFKVGACQKAEIIILDGLKFEQNSNIYANRVDALLTVADFYANSLHDDKTAEKYYLDLADEIKKPEFSVVGSSTSLFTFTAAADFLRERNKNEAVEIILEQLLANRKFEEDLFIYFDHFLDMRLTLAEAYKSLNKSEEEKKMYADTMSYIKSQTTKDDSKGMDSTSPEELEIYEASVIGKQANFSFRQGEKATAKKLYEQSVKIYAKYLTSTEKTNVSNDLSYWNKEYSLLLFELGDIEKEEKNRDGAIKYYEQAVTASNSYIALGLPYKDSDFYSKALTKAFNKRAEILESWASVTTETNRAEKLKEAQTFREKARQVSAESKSAKKKCGTAGSGGISANLF